MHSVGQQAHGLQVESVRVVVRVLRAERLQRTPMKMWMLKRTMYFPSEMMTGQMQLAQMYQVRHDPQSR